MRQTMMGTIVLVAIVCMGVGYQAGRQGLGARPAAVNMPGASIEVYFSPHGGCTDAIVREIVAARNTIDMQAYSFTSEPIAQALADAEHRGVHVTAVLDKNETKEFGRAANTLRVAHIPVSLDGMHKIAHNKVMLIDGQTVITGSFNFTTAAENDNAENLLILHNAAALCAQYEANFKEHLGHSESY